MTAIKRRSLLTSSLASALGATLSLGVARRAHAIRVPGSETMLDLHKRFALPVVIASIEQCLLGDDVCFRVRSADGATGVSYGNDRLQITMEMARQLVIPYFLKKDARDIETLVDGVYADRDERGSVYKFAGMPFWNVVGNIETAIFDMLGNLKGVPVHELLGGRKRDTMDVYVSQFGRETSAEQELENALRDMEKTGAKATKFKIGLRMANSPAQMQRDRKLVELARKVFGQDRHIFVDANGSYTVEEAIEMGRFLQKFRVGFFEEPLPFQDYAATKRTADALKMPVAGGEQDSSLWAFEDMINRKVVDLIQPDILYCGGIVRSLRIARMAAKVGMKFTPHCPEVLPTSAANLHVCAVVPNLGPFQEHRGFGQAVDGRIAVPMTPGLGVPYDHARWKKAKVL